MFGIFPKNEHVNIEGELVLTASIIIDGFQESINIPLTYWDVNDYKKSWLHSLEQGMKEKKHATLAVSMYNPEMANFVFAWVLYFEGNCVFVQNNVIFLNECDNFSPEKINDFVDERTTHDEDGIKISEWNTDIDSVIKFYEGLKGQMSLI